MMKNKYFAKGITIFLALVMAVVLATGCGGKDKDKGSATKPETKTEKTEPKKTESKDTADNTTANEPEDNGSGEGTFEDIRFVDAFYANNGQGQDFMIVFYESKDGDIAYVHDGKDEAFAPYKVEKATTENGTEYYMVNVGETSLGYYEEGDNIYLIDDEGTVYAAGRLTEEQAEELHKIVKQ